jgi:hypothetical protein
MEANGCMPVFQITNPSDYIFQLGKEGFLELVNLARRCTYLPQRAMHAAIRRLLFFKSCLRSFVVTE